MSKNGIYACQKEVVTCRKHGNMILRYLPNFFSLSLLKPLLNLLEEIAAGALLVGVIVVVVVVIRRTNSQQLLRTESVKCPAHAVFAKSRARHVHVMSLNLLTSRKSLLI